MSALASTALLLLLLVPTLGRLAGGAHHAGMVHGAAASLTEVPAHGHAATGEAAPAGGHALGQVPNPLEPDCDYCPLLAGLVVLLAFWLRLREVEPPHFGRLHRTGDPGAAPNYPGLGARGPPALI